MTKNFRIYGYLRVSTKEQDATRAKDALLQFAASSNLTVASFFIENESGAKLERPELFRLLDIAQAGDIILVEQIDRISRLNKAKTQGLYKGKREDKELHRKVKLLLSDNKSYNMIISLLKCSRGTIAKIAKRQE